MFGHLLIQTERVCGGEVPPFFLPLLHLLWVQGFCWQRVGAPRGGGFACQLLQHRWGFLLLGVCDPCPTSSLP
jgi:hypothetical protein